MSETKEILLREIEKNYGIVSDACKAANISRSTFYNLKNSDKDFANEVDTITDIAIDFVESKLYKAIDEGNITAIIFFLKTKGKKRGYTEKQEIEVTNGTNAIEYTKEQISAMAKAYLLENE
ncbi:MAG: hypothetical protein NT007_14940 [Candidatus Kapabacteria bacterium]|nr:hypothetical protein [Candidatus Kapabacteria bacterium]